jgi:hypothetical protein
MNEKQRGAMKTQVASAPPLPNGVLFARDSSPRQQSAVNAIALPVRINALTGGCTLKMNDSAFPLF